MDDQQLKNIVEAALFAAGEPLSLERLASLFEENEQPPREAFLKALGDLQTEYEARGIELAEVAGGFRFHARKEVSLWVSRLWEERPARYSRALLETLALIAYRQPITRAEIEEIRGVTVTTHIVKTLQEREWVRVVGHRDVPGRPAMYATTRQFLDYFNLKSLADLPPLAELRDIDKLNAELDLQDPGTILVPAPSEGEEADAADAAGRANERAADCSTQTPGEPTAEGEALTTAAQTREAGIDAGAVTADAAASEDESPAESNVDARSGRSDAENDAARGRDDADAAESRSSMEEEPAEGARAADAVACEDESAAELKTETRRESSGADQASDLAGAAAREAESESGDAGAATTEIPAAETAANDGDAEKI